MKLNIKVPQGERKKLRFALGEGRNGKLLKWYWCKQSCIGCNLRSFDTNNGIHINDLDKKECNNRNLKTPIISVRVDLNKVEKLFFS